MDYFVPNFGRDRDVTNTWNSLEVAQDMLKHDWSFDPESVKKGADPVLYNFAPELDDDMKHTNKHMAAAEKNLGTWDYEALQIESDPICHSAGCTQYKHPKAKEEPTHPMDYFVPHFGKDRDVTGTWKSIETAQEMLDHNLTIGEEKVEKAADPVMYNYAPELDDDMKHTNLHMAAAEKSLGTWDYEALQLEEQAYESQVLANLMK